MNKRGGNKEEQGQQQTIQDTKLLATNPGSMTCVQTRKTKDEEAMQPEPKKVDMKVRNIHIGGNRH